MRTDFTLTEARVLFELGREDGLTATTLRERLKLDAGYLAESWGASTPSACSPASTRASSWWEEEPHESFGRRLVGQYWARSVGP